MAKRAITRREMIAMSIGLGLTHSELRNDIKNLPEKRTIPSSGEKIPVVGLGTWRVFDHAGDSDKVSVLKSVMSNLVKNGASVLDSSPMYGSSESVVGSLSEELKNRSSLFMATKVWTNGKQQGIDQMNDSFRKMKTSTMDLMQVHNLMDVSTHLKTLYEWKAQKKIRYIGITHYIPSYYDQMIELIRNEKLDFIQCCYNIETRDAEEKLIPFAKDHGVAVVINRPFQEGALIDATRGKIIPPWAKDLGITSWPQYFLKFILSNPGVTCTIPGTSNPVHIEENINSGQGYLPDAITRKNMVNYFRSL